MTKKPRDVQFAFFGMPPLGVPVLSALEDAGFVPRLVVASPDRPQGRGLKVASPPTVLWARERGIDVAQPERIDDAFIEQLKADTWDVFIVAAFGHILPYELLDIPAYGTLNVHPSLLPRLRGASPIRAAIRNNEKDAVGVTIMLLDEQMDHGPIVAQEPLAAQHSSIGEVFWPPKARELERALAKQGGKLLASTLLPFIRGEITPREQDHDAATYCRKTRKEDGLLDLADDPWENFLKIQAADGWPGAYFIVKQNGKEIRVKITDAAYENGELIIRRVIPEGKHEMGYEDFLRGNN